jgi:hypothetical protein
MRSPKRVKTEGLSFGDVVVVDVVEVVVVTFCRESDGRKGRRRGEKVYPGDWNWWYETKRDQKRWGCSTQRRAVARAQARRI